MLLDFKVKGYKVFYDEVFFTMKANNYIKKNMDNVFDEEINGKKYSAVKTAVIFGPNNAGKSCFLQALMFLAHLIKEEKIDDSIFKINFFQPEQEMEFSIEFIENEKIYNYHVFIKDDNIENEILYVNNNLIFNLSDPDSFKDQKILELYNMIGGYKQKLFVLTLPQEKYKSIVMDFKKFFSRFEFIDQYITLPSEKSIESLINSFSTTMKDDIIKIIKDSDLSIDNVMIDNSFIEKLPKRESSDSFYNSLKLLSENTFKNKTIKMPFFFYNSEGTKKVALIAEKIVNAITNNKILIIDDISDGLHTVLTKNIFSYFNSKYNTKAQIITSSQDLLLLDDVYLFRKDQIWFIYKDKDGNYLYCLDDFKDNNKVDARGNVLIRYLKGLYGALPMPNLGGINDKEV